MEAISLEHRAVLKHIRWIKDSRNRLPAREEVKREFLGERPTPKERAAYRKVIELLYAKACIFDKLDCFDTVP